MQYVGYQEQFQTADIQGLMGSANELHFLIIDARKNGNNNITEIVDSYIDMVARDEAAEGYPLDKVKYKQELSQVYSKLYNRPLL